MAKYQKSRNFGLLAVLAFASFYLGAVWLFARTDVSALIVALCLTIPLIWLSLTDVRRQEIPDLATFLVALVGVAVWSGNLTQLFINLLVAGTLTLILFLVTERIWRQSGRDVLGLGDVKLIGAGAIVVPAEAIWLMILLAALGGIAATLMGVGSAGRGVPFGPFLAYAIFVTHLISGAP